MKTPDSKNAPAKGWTPERRAAQAERCRAAKPWLAATGPRTADGKAASAGNALRHGMRSAGIRELRRLLAEQRRFVALVRAGLVQ